MKQLGEIGDQLIQKIKYNISSEVLRKFRSVDISYEKSMQENLESTKRQIIFGDLFVNLVILLSISATINRIIIEYFHLIDV